MTKDDDEFERVTLAQAQRWVINARPGAQLVYGRGLTCRHLPPLCPGAADPEVADWLREQAAKGFVQLFQKPTGPAGTAGRQFLYLAVRVVKTWDPQAPLPGAPRPYSKPSADLRDQVQAQVLRAQIRRVFA